MTSLLCTEPRTILILGTGYLGRALAERLREAGHIPLTADIDPQQAIYEADMTDSASMHRLAARIPAPCIPGGRKTRWKHSPENRLSSAQALPCTALRTDAG